MTTGMPVIENRMNCDAYRQAIGAEPQSAGFDAHAETCADCRAYRDELRAFDVRVAAALTIDVPPLRMPALPDVDVANVATMVTVAPSRTTFMRLALAASVILAAFVAFRLLAPAPVYGSLAEEVLAHLDHEPAALRVTDVPVSDRRFARAVPASRARFDRGAALVTYAQSCVINGKDVPHLVIQGERGPVTILLMPDEKVDEVTPIDGNNVQGVIVPVGDGSIAILGDRDEPLGQIKETVLNSVTWTT